MKYMNERKNFLVTIAFKTFIWEVLEVKGPINKSAIFFFYMTVISKFSSFVGWSVAEFAVLLLFWKMHL